MQPMEPMKTMDLLNDELTEKSDSYLYENSDGVKVQSELELNMEIGLKFIGLTLNSDIDETSNNANNKLPKSKENKPKSYQSLIRAIAENAKLSIKKYQNNHLYVDGDLGNLNLKDLRQDTLYENILSLKSKDNPQIAKFEWWSYDKERMNDSDFIDDKMYDKKLKFHMNSIRVVYFHPFLSEIIHYITHSMVYVVLKPDVDDVESIQQSMEENKPKSYHESAEELKDLISSHFRLDISTSNPVLIIPRHLQSPECFKLDLGAVSIKNECKMDDKKDVLNVITIKTTKFKLGTLSNNIASDVGATIHLQLKMNQYCFEPDNIFTIHVPEYDAVMRHEQYTLILKLIWNNFTAEPSLSPIPYTVDHIKESINIQNLKHIEEKPGSSSFKLQIDKASLTLIHDLQKDRNTDICLAKLQLTDVIIANLSTRSHENTFSVKIGSSMISDLRNLANHVFGKILCRVQDIIPSNQLKQDLISRDKDPSFEIIWKTKTDEISKYYTESIDVSIVDACSFCIGSTMRHLYDWFMTTNDSFIDKYPAPKSEVASDTNPNDEKSNADEWDSEFNVNVNLINSRLILLRNLTKRDCDALVTQGNTTVTIKTITSFSKKFAKSDTEIKLNDFKLHFAKGNQLGFGKGDRIQVLEPSDFNFIKTYYTNFATKEEFYQKKLSLKKITIIGVTTERAMALRDIISNFVNNFSENRYIDCNEEENEPLYNAEEVELEQDHEIHLDLERKFEREEQDMTNLESIHEADISTKYKSQITVEFGRLDVFMHDETSKALPKIFSFGFHNFELSAASELPQMEMQIMTINMLWHANKHYNDTWSPLVCPWNCQIKMRQSDNPATSIVIEGKQPLDVFVSDIVIRAFVQNAQQWINAFKIKTSVPNVADVQNQFIQSAENENASNISSKDNDAPAKKVLTNYRFKFVVPKFSMYIEQPIEQRTLCKIVCSEYSLIYVGDQDKDTIEIKMKYCAIDDFVQKSGKEFCKLIESMHSKSAKHVEFLYLYFEHWKLPRIKKAKDKLQLYLDTLKINYNPDTILTLIDFANSITQKNENDEIKVNDDDEFEDNELIEIENKIIAKPQNKKPRIQDTSLTLRLSFDFRQLYINLNKPHLNRQVIEFGLSKTHISFKLYRDFSCDLHGRIGNLTAADLTIEGEYASKLRNNLDSTILGLRDSNSKTLLDFKYSTNLIDGHRHRYDQSLKVTLSSVKIKYYHLLIMEFIDYINAGILGIIYGDVDEDEQSVLPKQLNN